MEFRNNSSRELKGPIVIHRLRNRRGSSIVPVAAEVLETRALLSSGATAAHAAAHHAAVQTQAIAPHAFKGLVIAKETIQGGIPENRGVSFSFPNFSQTNGTKVTAHMSSLLSGPGFKETIKATFIGTITNVQTVATKTTITLTPTGGNLNFTVISGGQHATLGAVPTATPMQLVLDGGVFRSFSVTDVFKPNAPGGAANKTITFDITIA